MEMFDKVSNLSQENAQVRDRANKLGKVLLKLKNPKNIMIVSKIFEPRIIELTKQLACHIIDKTSNQIVCQHSEGLNLFLDSKLKNLMLFDYEDLITKFPHYANRIHWWAPEKIACNNKQDTNCVNGHEIHVIITLGGDGTVLYTSWLFQNTQVPPIVAFRLGSLGFLTNFSDQDIKPVLQKVVGCNSDGVRVNMRMRFSCTVWRSRKFRKTGILTKKNSQNKDFFNSNDLICFGVGKLQNKEEEEDGCSCNGDVPASPEGEKEEEAVAVETFQILNDLVIDRGPSPYMSLLELYVDDLHVTTVQADGLVIATPTGSTAYSLSAGASICHPQVPAMLVTPICPHTLSFRPMLLPDNITFKVQIPFDDNSRSNNCWVAFDGRHRIELCKGDYITVTSSPFFVPTICTQDQSNDWFESLQKCLHWNQRTRQKGNGPVKVEIPANPQIHCGLSSNYTDSFNIKL